MCVHWNSARFSTFNELNDVKQARIINPVLLRIYVDVQLAGSGLSKTLNWVLFVTLAVVWSVLWLTPTTSF